MIAAKLNAAGVATTHGGPWLPGTVRVVMLRHRDRWDPSGREGF